MIRRRFVERDLIEAAVLLPENLYYSATAGTQVIFDTQTGLDGAAGERICERWSV